MPAITAAKASRRDLTANDAFPWQEIDWFSRNSYNLAIKMCAVWEAGATLRMVQASSKLQHYLDFRKTMGGFRSLVHEHLSKLKGGAKSDLQRKYACLLAFDFEAAARLKSWASFEDLTTESRLLNDPDIYSVMADIVLTCEAPSEVVVATLQVRTAMTPPAHLKLTRTANRELRMAAETWRCRKVIPLDQVLAVPGHAVKCGHGGRPDGSSYIHS
ncbi:MAG: hypothetical protein Q9218_000343 [Villophora microphyllina]